MLKHKKRSLLLLMPCLITICILFLISPSKVAIAADQTEKQVLVDTSDNYLALILKGKNIKFSGNKITMGIGDTLGIEEDGGTIELLVCEKDKMKSLLSRSPTKTTSSFLRDLPTSDSSNPYFVYFDKEYIWGKYEARKEGTYEFVISYCNVKNGKRTNHYYQEFELTITNKSHQESTVRPFLSVDSGHINGLVADVNGGQGATINVTSNVKWQITEKLSWVNLSNYSGNGNGSFTVYVDANDGAARDGYITVSGENCDPISIYISQPGAAKPNPATCNHVYSYDYADATDGEWKSLNDDYHVRVSLKYKDVCTICGDVRYQRRADDGAVQQKHTFGKTNWSQYHSDEVNHWRVGKRSCTAPGCDYVDNVFDPYTKHSFAEGTCACGYQNASADTARLAVWSDYDSGERVYMKPGEEVGFAIRIIHSDGTSYFPEVGETKDKYQIVLSETNDKFRLTVSKSGKLVCTKNVRDWGIAGTIQLKDVENEKVLDQREICYVNTYRKGLFNSSGYTSSVTRLSEVKEVTDGHGYTIHTKASKRVELVNVQASERKQDQTDVFPRGYYDVTFDAINATSVSYGVEVYDANDKRVKEEPVKLINPYSPTAPICRVMYEGGKALLDTLMLDPEKAVREQEAEKTHIQIRVPDGGYVMLTESCDSEDVWEANMIDAFFTLLSLTEKGVKLVKDVRGGSLSVDDWNYLVDKRGLAVYFVEAGLYENLAKKMMDAKKLTKEVLTEFVLENEHPIREGLKKYLSLDRVFDPKKLLTAIGNTVEGAVVKLNPAVYAAETVTNFATVSDRLLALTQELGQSEPQLKIKYILMPYQSNPASQDFQ